MRIKKIFSVFLVLSLAFVLASCEFLDKFLAEIGSTESSTLETNEETKEDFESTTSEVEESENITTEDRTTTEVTDVDGMEVTYNDNNATLKFTKREVPYENLAYGFETHDSNITAYFPDGKILPYVGVYEVIQSLDGYLLSDSYSVSTRGNIVRLEVSFGDSYEYYELDVENELITASSVYVLGNLNASEEVDYSGHFMETGSTTLKYGEKSITYDLKPYDYNLVKTGNDCLMPLGLLQALLTPNIYHLMFNGEKFFLTDGYLDIEVYYQTINKDLQTNLIPLEVLNERNNQIYFFIDYLYGLRNVYELGNAKEYVNSKPELKQMFNERDALKSNQALINLLLSDFNDPHTSLGYKNYYQENNSVRESWIPYYYDQRGERTATISNKMSYFYDQYAKTFGNEADPLKIVGNTAFITFDSFIVGYTSQIKNPDGSIKEDAWKYDTYYLFKRCFEEISLRENIENVVLDLSKNGGGSVSALYSTIGFLTNKDIRVAEGFSDFGDIQSTTFAIDSDGDGDYTDQDGYDNYNYYILVSGATFSAANYFTTLCKDMGLATLIGEHTGGGMCAVNELNLVDGSTFRFSSNYYVSGLTTDEAGNLKSYYVELGQEVEHQIAVENYYNFELIAQLINGWSAASKD